MWLVAAAPKELGRGKQTASCFVFVCVLLEGEGDVDAKGVLLLPAMQARVANIWRYSPNIPRQLL